MIGDPIKFTFFFLMSGDPKMDRFMHSADVFEPFKRLVDDFKPQRMVLKGEVSDEGGPKWANIVNAVVSGSEQKLGRKMLAAWVEGQAEGAWADPTCRSLSNGFKWVVFHKWLAAYGYPGKHPDLTPAKG
jgi:hypothetical protein